jgi:hypothetical protein
LRPIRRDVFQAVRISFFRRLLGCHPAKYVYHEEIEMRSVLLLRGINVGKNNKGLS